MKKFVAILIALTSVVGFEAEFTAAAASCKAESKNIELPDAGDGDHIAAKIPTVRGALEIYVQIKTGKVAGMTFYLDGKEMKNSEVPKAARSCIKSASMDGWRHSSALLDWLIPPAEAKGVQCKYNVEEADFGNWGIVCVTATCNGFKGHSCQVWSN